MHEHRVRTPFGLRSIARNPDFAIRFKTYIGRCAKTHLFMHHSSTIAGFLNNIRWEIYEYLRPEFSRAFGPLPEPGMARQRNIWAKIARCDTRDRSLNLDVTLAISRLQYVRPDANVRYAPHVRHSRTTVRLLEADIAGAGALSTSRPKAPMRRCLQSPHNVFNERVDGWIIPDKS